MKYLTVILIAILAPACIVDPAFNVYARYVNTLNDKVTLVLYPHLASSQIIILQKGENYEYFVGGDSPPVLYNYDSVRIILSNDNYKTDINCLSVYEKDSLVAQCNKDVISLFNQNRYKSVSKGKNNTLYIYEINESDSLETHP